MDYSDPCQLLPFLPSPLPLVWISILTSTIHQGFQIPSQQTTLNRHSNSQAHNLLRANICIGEVQDGGGVRRGDHLPPHKYIKNTSTCGKAPTEHLLNTGRRPQTSQKARNSQCTWPCGWQSLGAPARCQAWTSEVGEPSSGHWSTRDHPALRNITRWKLSQRFPSQRTKTQLHSTTSRLQCWTPYAKQLARQEHNATH